MMTRIHSILEGLFSFFSFLFGNHFGRHHANVSDNSKILVSGRTPTMERPTVKNSKISRFTIYLNVVTQRLFINILRRDSMSDDSSFHMLLFVVFREVNMGFGDAYESSTIGSSISEGHNALVTPDAFLDWGLVDVKAFILWSEGEFVKSIRKVYTVEWALQILVFPKSFENGSGQFSQFPLKLCMSNVLHESSMMRRRIISLDSLRLNIISVNFAER